MIRYRFSGLGVDAYDAVSCAHPRLRRLRCGGPWAARRGSQGLELTQEPPAGWTPTAWGPWQRGLDDCEYQVADPLPDLALLRRPVLSQAAWIDHSQHGRIPVLPATRSARRLDLHGEASDFVSDYGRLAFYVFDRLRTDDQVDREVLDVVRLALASCHRVTAEACHALGLMTDLDLGAILAGAFGVPKA